VKQPKITVVDALDALEPLLSGGTRAAILEEVMRTGGFVDSLRRLRSSMAAHSFATEDRVIDLAKPVRKMDHRTRQDGFRVLHSWNHSTHRFTEDVVPVLMLDFFERAEVSEPNERLSLSILLDFYFLHLLSLCAVRAWDDGDPDENLDRLTRMVGELQGAEGSGHRFVADAETLLIYALSQFHPEERAYDRMIAKVATLHDAHQVTFACVSAAVLSAHLRWGFWLMYERDAVRMRRDNVGDYPWLLNSVTTLMRDYSREAASGGSPRENVVGALLLGLAADPWAFAGAAPKALIEYQEQYRELTDLLREHGERVLVDFEALRPGKDSYSPLALHFNFPHNTIVAIVTLALLEGRPQALPLNALFSGAPGDAEGAESRERLARTLMEFSRANPDRLGHRGAMLVAYDHLSGLRSFSLTVDAIGRKG
jgi:hypothetical protein